MDINREMLEALVEELERAYDTAVAKVIVECPDVDPNLVKDPQGRYILLDALSTLVNARMLLDKWYG